MLNHCNLMIKIRSVMQRAAAESPSKPITTMFHLQCDHAFTKKSVLTDIYKIWHILTATI